MNKKLIEEIAKKAVGIPKGGSVGASDMGDWKVIDKFAELIVRECANHCDLLLDHKISSEWSRGTHDCSRAIKKHFGVER